METLKRPEPPEVARLAGGGEVSPTESPTSFAVKTTLRGVSSIVVDGGQLPQVRVRTELSSGLTLRDLSAELGEPKTLFESKTSSAVFELERRGERVTVFVRLFTPKVSDSSPVVALQIRQEDAAPMGER